MKTIYEKLNINSGQPLVEDKHSPETTRLLAKLMAQENIFVAHVAGLKTANFNVNSRVLSLPIIDKKFPQDTYEGFVGHEIGHALFTPSDDKVLIDAIKRSKKSFVNVVEDARIERKVVAKYRGMGRVFKSFYKILYTEDFFGPLKTFVQMGGNVNERYSFIDRINLYFKLGSFFAAVKFTDEEKVYVKMVAEAETFEDAAAAAEAIFNYMKLPKEKEEEEEDEDEEENPDEQVKVPETDNDPNEMDGNQGENGTEGDGTEDENADGDKESSEDKESGKDYNDADGTEEDESSDGSGGDEDNEKSSADDETSSEDSNADENENAESGNNGDEVGGAEKDNNADKNADNNVDDVPDAVTVDQLEHAMERLVAIVKNEKYFNVTAIIPKVITENVIIPYSTVFSEDTWKNCSALTLSQNEKVTEFLEDVKPLITFMAQQFDRYKRARVFQKSEESKTGIIDQSKLVTYQTEEDIFLRDTILPVGKNHGYVVFLDWSSSMSACIRDTMEQMITLALFFRKINVPFEIYAFKNRFNKTTDVQLTYPIENKANESHVYLDRGFRLLNLLSSRMSRSEFHRAIPKLFMMASDIGPYSLNSTPLNSAIVTAMELIPSFQQAYRLSNVHAIFLTDGDSDDLRVHDDNGGRVYYNDDISFRAHSGKLYTSPPKSVAVDYKYGHDRRFCTGRLFKILHEETKVDVIGIRIIKTNQANYHNFDDLQRYFPTLPDPIRRRASRWDRKYGQGSIRAKGKKVKSEVAILRKKILEELNQEGYFKVNVYGENEHYVVSSKLFNRLPITDLFYKAEKSMGKAALVNTFLKGTKNRQKQRILMGDIAAKIA